MLRLYLLPTFCACFLLVIAALSQEWRGVILLIILIAGLTLIRNKILGAVMLFSVALAIGIFSFAYRDYLQRSQADGQKIVVEAYIQQKELRSNNRQRITFVAENKYYQATLFRYPILRKGDWIRIECIFEQPKAFSGFHYPRYLYSQGIDALCHPLSVQVIPAKSEKTLLESGRIIVAKKIKQLWPRPVSSLVAGLLLGTRESFSQGVLDNFSRSGVTHIIALSGFNISILIVFIERLLIQLYVPRNIRAILVIVGIFSFTIFVGAGASIMRAAIMGSLAYVLMYFGRTSEIWRSMLLTATVMTMTNPFVLMYDIGFQLSFLSTLGLVYLTPVFTKMFMWLPEILSFRESFVTTVSATIATLPLILLKFGVLSVVSPIANVLILPVIPWLMLAGFMSLFIPVLLPDLTTSGSRYVLLVSEVFASPKWASQTVEISPMVFMLFGGLIAIVVYVNHLYEKKLD